MRECQTTLPMHTRSETSSTTGTQRDQLATFCKALGHPARVQIVQVLSSVETCFCGDIVQQLPLAQSTVSQHLKILKEAGIVQGEIDGPRMCYWLNREALATFKALVATLP